jgi:hypothetical protein
VALDGLLATTGGDLRRARAEVLEQRFQPRPPPREVIGVLDPALQERHGQSVDGRAGWVGKAEIPFYI